MSQNANRDRFMKHNDQVNAPSPSNTPLNQFLSSIIKNIKQHQLRVGHAVIDVDIDDLSISKIAQSFKKRGVFSKEVLAERAINGLNISKEATRIDVSPLILGIIYDNAIQSLDENTRLELQKLRDIPHGLGELDPNDPDHKDDINLLGIDKIRKVSFKEISKWAEVPFIPFLIPKGPINAVDHRPFLGDARNQGGRVTCTAFGSTAVAEALEFLRDSRPGPRNLAEQLIFWYSKSGQLYTAGGYSCGAALRHHSEYGTCEEFYFPYNASKIVTNHAQLPMPDEAMDRAQFYRTGEVVALPSRDVEAVKNVLRSGRCVGVIHNATDWNTAAGTYTMPDPLDSKGVGGNHCTSIIGFIDRDDLPAEMGGGYFIERNSWGGANSTTHLMGPEYGGHLLMPYGWYSRYSHSAYTLADDQRRADNEREWLVEYYENRSLSGAPIESKRISANVSFFNVNIDVPDTVDELNFDWGNGSALKYDLPFPFGDVDVLPKDNFSIRFTKVKHFRNGYYRFKLKGDDGIRLYVDDTLVINVWKNQPVTEYVQEHFVTGGDHVIRVEYYEKTGRATVEFDVEPILFEYKLFSNTTLSGSPASTFTDTLTNLEWRHAPPVSSFTQGQFSLQTTADLSFDEGIYKFHSIHSGGCRIYLNDSLVLDDWNGTNSTGSSQAINAGTHTVKIEFKQEEGLPALGDFGYYKSALNFGWAKDSWDGAFYQDDERKKIADARWPNPDSLYEGLRTQALTGSPLFSYSYPAQNTVDDQYSASDGVPLRLLFGNAAEFSNGVPGSPDLNINYLSAHFKRRVFIEEEGYYNVQLLGGTGSRLIVDGKEILGDQVSGTAITNDDVFLKAGVRDIALEWSVTKWGKKIDFKLDKVEWNVKYYDGIEFDTLEATKTLNNVNDLIGEKPTTVGASTYSIKASRGVSLPLGKYRFRLKTDDGARLKINGITIIDAWTDQGATNYFAEVEHNGGGLKLDIEYYQKSGGSVFEFELAPVGYFAEYYKGNNLEKPEAGSTLDRNVPIAYRFVDDVNFELGYGDLLNRVGSDNFSARWRGRIDLPVGRWKIDLTADDGVRLYVGGRLLIDQWKTQNATTYSRKVDLVGRRQDIKVEYFEKSGRAQCKLKFVRLF